MALVTRSNEESKKRKNKKKNFNKNLTCSFGHVGHTDKKCRDKMMDDLKKEIVELKKEKFRSTSTTNAAKLVVDESKSSHWDEAFIATDDQLSLLDAVILDSGSTCQMFKDRIYFESISEIQPSRIGVASKGTLIIAKQKGTAVINGLRLDNVLYPTQLSANLISISKLCDSGLKAELKGVTGAIVNKDGKVILEFERNPSGNKLWHPKVRSKPTKAYHAQETNTNLGFLWHRRLGHAHPAAVQLFLQNSLGMHESRVSFSCSDCTLGKIQRSPATKPLMKSTRVLEIIHSDLLSPISPLTVSGYKYIMTLIDDYTRHSWIYLLRSKDEVFKSFVNFKTMVEKETNSYIFTLKSDRGG